jgi:hypothetical protein
VNVEQVEQNLVIAQVLCRAEDLPQLTNELVLKTELSRAYLIVLKDDVADPPLLREVAGGLGQLLDDSIEVLKCRHLELLLLLVGVSAFIVRLVSTVGIVVFALNVADCLPIVMLKELLFYHVSWAPFDS